MGWITYEPALLFLVGQSHGPGQLDRSPSLPAILAHPEGLDPVGGHMLLEAP